MTPAAHIAAHNQESGIIDLSNLSYPTQPPGFLSRAFHKTQAPQTLCMRGNNLQDISEVKGMLHLLKIFIPDFNINKLYDDSGFIDVVEGSKIHLCHGLKALQYLADNWKSLPVDFKATFDGTTVVYGLSDMIRTHALGTEWEVPHLLIGDNPEEEPPAVFWKWTNCFYKGDKILTSVELPKV